MPETVLYLLSAPQSSLPTSTDLSLSLQERALKENNEKHTKLKIQQRTVCLVANQMRDSCKTVPGTEQSVTAQKFVFNGFNWQSVSGVPF